MQAQENLPYVNYAKELFGYLKNCNVGQGYFVFRGDLRNKFGNKEHVNYIQLVAFNLLENGFITADDDKLSGFIKLTDRGYGFMQGGTLEVNKSNIATYIDYKDSKEIQFSYLWNLIGKQDEAPFYVSGPEYFKMIKPYLKGFPYISYNSYIEALRKDGLSSRSIWYKKLYLQLNVGDIKDFLFDLDSLISLKFKYSSKDDGEYFKKICKEKDNEIRQIGNFSFDIDEPSQTPEGLFETSIEVCNTLKRLIEDNRAYQLIYNDDGTPKGESDTQMLLFCISKIKGEQYGFDVNRESDTGIGNLDCKFSIGNRMKTIIELKLSSNCQLKHGYEKQLRAYLRAEDTPYGIYLIVKISGDNEKVISEIEKDKIQYPKTVKVIVIDARKKSSASKF